MRARQAECKGNEPGWNDQGAAPDEASVAKREGSEVGLVAQVVRALH